MKHERMEQGDSVMPILDSILGKLASFPKLEFELSATLKVVQQAKDAFLKN